MRYHNLPALGLIGTLIVLGGCSSSQNTTPSGEAAVSQGGGTATEGQISTVNPVPPAVTPSETKEGEGGTSDTVQEWTGPHVEIAPGTDATATGAVDATGSLTDTGGGGEPKPADDSLAKHNQFLNQLKKIEVLKRPSGPTSYWRQIWNPFYLKTAWADHSPPSFPGIITGSSRDNTIRNNASLVSAINAFYLNRDPADPQKDMSLSAILLGPAAGHYLEESVYRDDVPPIYSDAAYYFGSYNYLPQRLPVGKYIVRVYYNGRDRDFREIFRDIDDGNNEIAYHQGIFTRYYDGREDPRLNPELESPFTMHKNFSTFWIQADGRLCRQVPEDTVAGDRRPLCSGLPGGQEPDGYYTFALFQTERRVLEGGSWVWRSTRDDRGSPHLIGATVFVVSHGSNAASTSPNVQIALEETEGGGADLLIQMRPSEYPLPIAKARVVLLGDMPITGARTPHTTFERREAGQVIVPPVMAGGVTDPETGNDGIYDSTYTTIVIDHLNTAVNTPEHPGQVVTLARLATGRPSTSMSSVSLSLVRVELFIRVPRPENMPAELASTYPEFYGIPNTFSGIGVSRMFLP